MNIKLIVGVVGFALLFMITSCDNTSYFFKEQQTFDNASWSAIDTIDFKANIQDTTVLYNLGMLLKYNKNYAYQNIYLNIYTKFPDGKRYSKQVNIDFADKTGKWYGNCSGKNCTVEIALQNGAFFNQIGEYVFTVEQFTRNEVLDNIQSVQFHIEETGQKR